MDKRQKSTQKRVTTESGGTPIEFAHMIDEMLEDGSSKQKVYFSYRERRHISKVKMDRYEDVKYIDVGSCESTDYRVPFNERYLGATNITYSLLASLYDVNSAKLIACNIFENTGDCIRNFEAFMGKAKGSNLEARVIGMQNGSDSAMLKQLLEFLRKQEIPIVEADLFGNETRHIAIDSKQGMSFSILVNNINYRPGELISKLTMDQFRRSLSQASSQK
ncbi:MAG: hypothetical protein M1465_02315 [Candidatus Marsarchaeota archaeon]|jgi:hypothetical protein|nr:hypothetical protein [Candidatus Marsarchaeota archaeon]